MSSLRSDFAWTLAGNIFYSGSQWGILVALARLGSPELLGKYSFGVAIAAPVVMFTNLQLRSVQTSDPQRTRRFPAYLGFRLLATLTAIAIVLAVCLTMHYRPEVAAVVMITALTQAIEAVSDIYYGHLQLNGRLDRIAVSMILRGTLSIVVVCLTILLTHSLIWAVSTLTTVRCLVLIFYDSAKWVQNYSEGDVPEWRQLWRSSLWNRDTIKLFRLTLPLGIVALMLSMNTNIPRYFIEASLGVRDLGIFSAIAFLFSAGNMVIGALGQAAFVRLAACYSEGDTRGFLLVLRRLLLVGLALGAGGVFIAVTAGEKLLTVLYRPEYGRRADVLIWLMVAAAFSYLGQLAGYAVTAARFFNVQIPLFTVVTLTVAASSYLLIPMHGLLGAAGAILIAMIVQLVGCLAVLGTAVTQAARSVGEPVPIL